MYFYRVKIVTGKRGEKLPKDILRDVNLYSVTPPYAGTTSVKCNEFTVHNAAYDFSSAGITLTGLTTMYVPEMNQEIDVAFKAYLFARKEDYESVTLKEDRQ